jgi:hypothetical protein
MARKERHMFTTRRLLAGAALGLVFALAACGGSSTTTTAPASAAAAASERPSPAVQPPADSQAPAASEAPAASSEPSMPAISLAPGNAGDLEAMIPSTVGALKLQKTSFDGASIPMAGTPIDSSKLDPLLAKYGKTVADLRFAMGIGASGTTPTMVYALQLRGVPAAEFMSQIDSSATAAAKTTMGGKTVYTNSGGGISSVIYPKDDVVFIIVAGDTQAQAIVAALP